MVLVKLQLLANLLINILAQKKVGLVAADTFRAAATEQLKIWSDKTNSEFFRKEFSDPAALSFESIQRQ